ncbi:hypothetical protein [Streptomyces sp. NRRL S-920]|uniref:GNAT family N-acetyltransferase n=1 Tax=Streptomyces sp. NRRL S-920 TaxID=1463921 RepID=UPI0004C53C58
MHPVEHTSARLAFGTETVGILLGLAFDDLGLHRVWAARAPLNTASHKTLLRAGLQEEGRIRQHVLVRATDEFPPPHQSPPRRTTPEETLNPCHSC